MFVMRTNNNNNNKSNVTLLKENTGRHMERNEERERDVERMIKCTKVTTTLGI